MRAIVVHELGSPEVLRLEEAEMPEPGAGEVLVKVEAAGVNYADTGMRRCMMGVPHTIELPFTTGFEVSGTVAALGKGVTGVAEGTRVLSQAIEISSISSNG